MDASTLTAFSALMGSVVGAAASVTTTWLAQRYSTKQERARERTRQRESLYAEFIAEAAQLQVDAFGHQLDSAKAVVRIAALLNRVRLVSSEEVALAAKNCVDDIIKAYFAPDMTLEELFKNQPWRERDPIRVFSETCRREVNANLWR
jgi:hypothetical protein